MYCTSGCCLATGKIDANNVMSATTNLLVSLNVRIASPAAVSSVRLSMTLNLTPAASAPAFAPSYTLWKYAWSFFGAPRAIPTVKSAASPPVVGAAVSADAVEVVEAAVTGAAF